MIALDTNVVIRFLVEDDAEQTERAKRLIQSYVERDTPCFVPDIVLAEIAWVLRSSYKVARDVIAGVLQSLLRARHLAFESPDRFSQALRAYASGSGDFADYLIREQSRAAGCEGVATFDGDLLSEEGFLSVPN